MKGRLYLPLSDVHVPVEGGGTRHGENCRPGLPFFGCGTTTSVRISLNESPRAMDGSLLQDICSVQLTHAPSSSPTYIFPGTSHRLYLTCVQTGMAQSYPDHWGGQSHVSGATHHPPFKHSTSHTGKRQSSPSSTPLAAVGDAVVDVIVPPPPDHSDAHEQAPGAVQLPPFPQVCGQTGTVQFGPNHPFEQEQESGAAQTPPCSHVCVHRASSQVGAPV